MPTINDKETIKDYFTYLYNLSKLSKTDFEGNEGYNFDSTNPNNEVFKHNETLKKILSDLWIKIKVR